MTRRRLSDLQQGHQQAQADRTEVDAYYARIRAEHDRLQAGQVEPEHQDHDDDPDPVEVAARWLLGWLGTRDRAWTGEAQAAFVAEGGEISAQGWALVVERAGLVDQETSPGTGWRMLARADAPALRPAVQAHRARTWPM
ncbi:hypothetical protein ACFY2K_42825 [Kitasatospora sp. NPDC001309]|uniref:hypothetical protein n=1 Tax=Kitasatospora sp. NPDC001309 TaxID=3364013 RepID=UPI0036CE551A